MHRRTVALFVSIAALLLAAATAGAAGKAHHGSVYTLTNSAAGNAVAVFARADDGSLTPAGTVATGGLGTGAGLGSQGSIIVSGHKLFAVNAGSNSISYFRLRHDGLELGRRRPSGGIQPTSLTVHDHVLYVLNAGGGGNITGSPWTTTGSRLSPARRGRSAPAAPARRRCRSRRTARRSWSPRRRRARRHVRGGRARHRRRADRERAAGNTPFGFDFDKRGDVLTSEPRAPPRPTPSQRTARSP